MDIEQKLGAVVSATSAIAAAGTSDMTLMIFGVQLSVVLAAFAGAMISLTFMSGLGWRRALATIGSGTLAGSYLAPLVIKLIGTIIPGAVALDSDFDKPVAFLIALGFQAAVPVFLKWIEKKGQS